MMSVYLGRIAITEELLNRLVAPPIIKRRKDVNSLIFSIRDGNIYFTASGRLVLSYQLRGCLELEELIFDRHRHFLGFFLSLKLAPWYLDLLVTRHLERAVAAYPGISLSGNRVTVEMDALPQFAPLKNLSIESINLLSLLEVTLYAKTAAEITLDISLNPP